MYFSVLNTHNLKSNIQLTVDAVVFGYMEGKVSVLLVKRKYEPFRDSWALPGGFVQDRESLEEAVQRELREETGIEINYLEQLYSFGAVERDPRGRIVSVVYFCLVNPGAFKVVAATDASDVGWFDIKALPVLAFDHQIIIDKAIERLRAKITYEPIGFELLEDKFPFSDLEKLYTSLLDREIDRRNFKKKVNSLQVLDELDEKISQGRGRPASLYRFNKDRYFQLRKEGIIFEI